jgi:tRNA-Thr(GGU) m(6)t(6)A37 methyltransferase TsaA
VEIVYHPIGRVLSPFKTVENMPIQPDGGKGVRAEIEVFAGFSEGLADLDGFSHIILLYHFHKAAEAKLRVKPFLDHELRGTFATRAPARPNPIGLSIVRLIGIERSVLTIENVDMLDQTPVLDIKPYVPGFDHYAVDRIGWLEHSVDRVKAMKSDNRFQEDREKGKK